MILTTKHTMLILCKTLPEARSSCKKWYDMLIEDGDNAYLDIDKDQGIYKVCTSNFVYIFIQRFMENNYKDYVDAVTDKEEFFIFF